MEPISTSYDDLKVLKNDLLTHQPVEVLKVNFCGQTILLIEPGFRVDTASQAAIQDQILMVAGFKKGVIAYAETDKEKKESQEILDICNDYLEKYLDYHEKFPRKRKLSKSL